MTRALGAWVRKEACAINVPIRRYYEILAQYLARRRGKFAALVALMLLAIGLQVVNPQVMRYFIDAATTGDPHAHLVAAAVIFLAAAVLQQGLQVGAAYLGEVVAWGATNELREDLAAHALSLDMRYHHEKSPGEFIERIESDLVQFATFFSQMVIRVLGNVVLLIGILIALALVDWELGAAFALFATVTVVALERVRNVAVPHQKAQRDAETALFGFLEERLAGTEDIRSSGAVDFVLRRLHELQVVILHKWRKAALYNQFVWAAPAFMLAAGYSLAFVMGLHLFRQGIITIGTAYLIVHYIGLIARPIRELSQQVETLQNIGASVTRMSELLRERPSIVSGARLPAAGGPACIAFEGVGFGYAPDKPVLRELNFALAPGRVLGLLGRTGAGKTTLARLIFRLFDPETGRIALDGVDLRELDLGALRRRVAYVMQDVQLFQATVRDNITLFNPEVPDERIMGVLEALELTSWFATLPEGLDTRLQSGGRSLSAGEAQLLAFTRVFLRDPGLVILDEASSRLDPATERLIERAIDRLLAGRSAIIIAHRLGTLRRADEILVLEDGRAVEYGARAELAADPGSRFAKLHRTGLEELLA